MLCGKTSQNDLLQTFRMMLLCLCVLTIFPFVEPLLAQQIAPIIFENTFEDNTLPPMVTIHTVGNFISAPNIKKTTHFGSTGAFGFGKTDCTTNCWNDATATLRIELPERANIASIAFDDAELDGNWGSTGYVYVEGQLVKDGIFERLPWNDLTADSLFRHHALMVNLTGRVIEFKVNDITSSSEIYIDNIIITIHKILPVPLFEFTFDEPDLPSNVSVVTKGTFNMAPGFRTPPVFDGSKSFGFGKSTCNINALEDYTTSLVLDLFGPRPIGYVAFREAELDTNWGVRGSSW